MRQPVTVGTKALTKEHCRACSDDLVLIEMSVSAGGGLLTPTDP